MAISTAILLGLRFLEYRKQSMENLFSSIENAIKEKYGDLESPDYSFLAKEEEKNPYAEFVRWVEAQGFAATNDTDFNTDVSFHYRFEKNDKSYIVRMSLVGRFSVFARIDGDGIALIHEDETSDPLAVEILEGLKKYGIPCLDEETISRRYPISLIDLEEGEATVFNALFSTDNYR